MILGLDVSTSITGATILDLSGNIIYCEQWDFRNKKKFSDLLDKADLVRLRLFELGHRYKINSVYIEQPFTYFSSGGSSAKTMSTLQRFNGMVTWICFKSLGLKPEHVTAAAARKQCGLKIPRGENTKQKVLDFIVDKYPDFKVEYTKHNNAKPGVYDRADSCVVALAGLELWNQKS